MTLFGPKTTAGLVIRHKAVELLVMRGKTVLSRLRAPIEGAEPPQLTRAIQAAMSSAPVKTRKLAVSISSQDVLFRFFTIPAVSKHELDTAVQFEARKYIPFKTELLVWDYRTVPSSVPGQLEVIFAAIQRELFHSMQGAFAAAGIQPSLVEPRSLSLARLMAQGTERENVAPTNDFVCLVDVEQDGALLTIVKHGLPYLSRDIGFLPGGGTSPAGLPSSTSASAPEPAPEPLSAAPADLRAQRLLSELSVSINFFVREYPNTAVPRVILCGEEALIQPWCGWLSEQLHCPVELGAALMERRVQGGLPLAFASAVGLLQVAGDPVAGSIDFLKRSLMKPVGTPKSSVAFQEAVKREFAGVLKKTPQLGLLATVAVGLLAMAWLAGGMVVSAERRRLEEFVASNPPVGWGLERVSSKDLLAVKEQAAAEAALLKRIMDQRVSIAAKMDALARSLPDGVWLTSLTVEGPVSASEKSQLRIVANGACFLGGPAQELDAIQKFEEQVKGNPRFIQGLRETKVDQINAQTHAVSQAPYRTFQLTCAS